jgi:hypothetical protein
MATTIIDPAWEISELIKRFAELPQSQEPTWAVVQKLTGVKVGDLYEMLSILAQRLTRLKNFASTVRDDELEENMRKRAIQALD